MEYSTWTPIAKVYNPLLAGSIDRTDTAPHDNGIVRAMAAKYKPGKGVIGDAEKTIFAARLPTNLDKEGLISAFSDFGEIKRARLVRDIVTGHSKCYGFVEFTDSKAAYRAQRDGNRIILDEKEIFVDFECERTLKGWIPRRLGGGFGGKKESGQLRFGGKDRPFHKPLMIDHQARPTGDSFRDRLEAAEGDTGRWNPNNGRDRDNNRYHRDREDQYSRSHDKYGDNRHDNYGDDRRDNYGDRKSRNSDRDRSSRRDDRDFSRSDRSSRRDDRDSNRSSRRKSRERSHSRERHYRKRDRESSDSVSRQSDKETASTSDKYAEDFLKKIANEAKGSRIGTGNEPEKKKRHFQEFV